MRDSGSGLRVLIAGACAAVAVVLAAGAIYEQTGRMRDARRFPRIGRAVDIGGRTMNIYCSGEGGPAVILESGGAAAGYDWLLVQPRIAAFTRACWYDRAGLGWSDAGPMPRTSEAIARDLHALLHAAGVPPPYILAGQSWGGFNVRVFAGLYRNEVAGVVLVDSAHPDQFAYEPSFEKGMAHRVPAIFRDAAFAALPLLVRCGAVRYFHNDRWRFDAPGITPEQQAIMRYLHGKPESEATRASEGINSTTVSAQQVRASGTLGNLPLIVLTAGRPFTIDVPELAREGAAFQDIWIHKLQADLARLSTRGRQVIVADSGHGMHFERPDVIVDAVREVARMARPGRPD